MRRNYWVVVASMVVMALLAGCSDSLVAPVAAPSVAPASLMAAPEGRPSLSLSGGAAQNSSTDFAVGPEGGVFHVGNNVVVFPAHSICDPATSSYGAAYWDDRCQALKAPIRVHAEVRATIGGGSQVDFTPELRFVPSVSSARWVWMIMYTPEAVGATGDLSRFSILYTPSLGAAAVNDAATDPTMRTYVDTRSGMAMRRIKHFSGYVVNSGFAAEQ
jgi:hypothetical protein